jgi:hypothetical protein
VLYFEQASSTLISMAALRKANSNFLYNHVEDAFHIFSPDWILLFSCRLQHATNKWCLPQPLPPNLLDSLLEQPSFLQSPAILFPHLSLLFCQLCHLFPHLKTFLFKIMLMQHHAMIKLTMLTPR